MNFDGIVPVKLFKLKARHRREVQLNMLSACHDASNQAFQFLNAVENFQQ